MRYEKEERKEWDLKLGSIFVSKRFLTGYMICAVLRGENDII